jgi:hypothetical protein
MTRTLVLLWACTLFVTQARGQLRAGRVDPSRIPTPSHHYLPEHTFDTPSSPALWREGNGGLNAAFGSADELYLRSEVPSPASPAGSWTDTGWRGERLNAQLLIWSSDSLDQVRVSISDLVGPGGRSLGGSAVTSYLVRYVLSDYPHGATNTTCDAAPGYSVYLMPDRLEPLDRFDLPARSVRPVWLAIDIPADAEPGRYSGAVEIRSEAHQATLSLGVDVEPPVLPGAGDWAFRLDLWQNPWVVAEHFRLEPWSEEHKTLLRSHLRPYADAGGTFITTYAVHSPWRDNSHTVEGAMIDWIKKSDGSWTFDYTILDEYVALAMEVGIDDAITVYTPIPWAHRFRYLDEATGNHVYEEWPPESAQFERNWEAFLDDLANHLHDKGWFDKTYLGINENPLENTLATARLIKDHSPDWKITYAGDWHPELDGIVDDYSPILGSEPSRAELRERRLRGATTTYYVCCAPPQPNTFVFSDPIEGRYLGWYAAAIGYDGFLRWAYDAWPEDPDRDARHTLWPAGDTFLVYPGGVSSIRFEKLREGIVDYEKIRILRERAATLPDGEGKALMHELEAHLGGFIGHHDYSKRIYDPDAMEAAVHRGRRLMSALSARLGPQQSPTGRSH